MATQASQRESRTLVPRVREAMSTAVATIDAEAPVARAAERLAEEDVGMLAICRSGGRLSGVITDRDIVVRVIAQGLDPDALTVDECGSGEPATISPQSTLEEAARRMDERQVRRLPVTQAGLLVGVLSQADLAAHRPCAQAGAGSEGTAARRGTGTRAAGDTSLVRRLLRLFYESPALVYVGGFAVGTGCSASLVLLVVEA